MAEVANAAGVAITAARSQIGVPYRWAWATPGKGFDCSGLTMWAYGQAGITLPHYTGFQVLKGTAVTKDQLQPGDLVFPDSGHVQIYTGNGMIIEAPHSGANVREVPMWGFWKARRIVANGAQSFGLPSNPVGAGVAIGSDVGEGANKVSGALSNFDPGKYIDAFMSNARHWAIRVVEVVLGLALIIVGLDKAGGGVATGTVKSLAKYAK